MRSVRSIRAVCLLGVAAIFLPSGERADAQSLVPLGDEVDMALAPAGITLADVEMIGQLAYLWKDEAGSNVIQLVGDAGMTIGGRQIASRQAVVWMTPRQHEGRPYYHFEIVLWRDASVLEPSGTVTRGPALYVTLNARGKIRTSADHQSISSSADTPLFARALRIRNAMHSRSPVREEARSPMTVVNLAGRRGGDVPEVKPEVTYSARETAFSETDGRNVITAIGDVYLFRGAPAGGDAVEIRADAAVVYLSGGEQGVYVGESEDADRPGRARPDGEGGGGGVAGGLMDPTRSGSADLGLEGMGSVESVYLEGDIILSSGERTVRANRLYYDFTCDRALILDAAIQIYDAQRNLPIVMRATRVRQLSQREYRADDAIVTTNEFHTPHYHIGADEITLLDRTRQSVGLPTSLNRMAGTIEAKNVSFNLSGVPILFWPHVKANLADSETSIESIRTGYSNNFGAELETRWKLFNLLGFEQPPGVDASLRLDYFSDRGPAAGVDVDYETDNSFGLARGYYIHDSGQDGSVGRYRDPEPPSQSRGRALIRHRQYLPDDWEITFELSYISDRNFLREYFESEFKREKEQETRLYAKKQVDNWAFTAELQYHIMDFVTTTERLPEFAFRLMGEPLAGMATLFSENRAGWVRYRPADLNLFENLLRGGREHGSGTAGRADTRQEIEVPLAIGDLKVVPFGSIRGSVWDDTPYDGGRGRGFATYGLRGSMYASKIFPDLNSELLDINGIRHIIKADVVAWAGHSSLDRDDLFPFDETVEQIDDVSGVSFGLRQRWQTKRGAPDKRRTVDVVTFDVEVGAFDNASGHEFTNGFVSYSRPENSVARNYLNTALQYRINDATSLVSEMNYDINDGEVDLFDLTYAVQRTPRLSYLIAYRYIGEMESNLLAAGMNYRINEKYVLAVREEFDLERGETATFDIGVIRRFPRWFVGMTFSLDEIEDDFGVSLTAWPEGMPQAALGNRRFTGLVTSTAITPGS